MAFRRVDLPNDPNRASSLEELGYFIDENDKIARIDDPSNGHRIKANKNPRYSETRHEDFQDAIRRVIESRLVTQDILTGYLPKATSGALHRVPDTPQVPVFFSKSITQAEKCESLVLLVGTSLHDPHILSHYILENEGINAGSIVNFVKDIHAREGMGVIVANSAQRIWSKTLQKAVTYATYDALPRDKATDLRPILDQDSYIFGHGNQTEHLSVLFKDFIIPAIEKNHKHPKLYILCIGDAVQDVFKFLQSDWSQYQKSVAAIVACNGSIDKTADMYHTEFLEFWSERCKHYWVDSLPIDTPIEVVPGLPNYFSSGALVKRQNVFHQIYSKAFDYFEYLHDNPSFKLPPFVPIETFNDLDEKVNGHNGGWTDSEDKEIRNEDSGAILSSIGNKVVPDVLEHKDGSQ